MSNKNFVCTGKGFIKSASHKFDSELMEHVFEITYTDKVREAKTFKINGGIAFMEKYGIVGFVWKPYKEDPLRNMYVVRKSGGGSRWGKNDEEENTVEEWVVEKAFMANESDVKFLTSKNQMNQNVMEFEDAKVKALRLNIELVDKLNYKIRGISKLTKPEK